FELIMFVEDREGVLVQWLGPVYGPEGVVEFFGADSAYKFEMFGSCISSYLNSGLYQTVYVNLETNQSVADSFYNSVADTLAVYNVDEIVDALRIIKSPIEINSIQKAVDVSVQAFSEALKTIEPGMYEYEVEALFDYILGVNGCSRTAFPTIVASGRNINVLHYQANQRQMHDGELVIIDFGAEYGYYASDITRTIPVNGKFSPKQATIYEIVLEAHQAAINGAAPGVSYYELYLLARDLMLDRLIEKGIITGKKSDIISSHTYRQYIPAGLAHCVGLDAHDPFPKNEQGDKILKENMVLAFEPHIYLFEGDQTVDQDYWNISVRIEDIVFITTSGSEILSKHLPVEIQKIEELMK
ncbi:MAG: aminopeptidase P family protein, partial [bacterium]